MAKKNNMDGGIARSKPKAFYRGQASATTPRLSPIRIRSPESNSSPSSSMAGSPPLGAGHYAGCKWTDPPLPSTLPPPPQHWMQQQSTASSASMMPFHAPRVNDIENQLKVLLKVQA